MLRKIKQSDNDGNGGFDGSCLEMLTEVEDVYREYEGSHEKAALLCGEKKPSAQAILKDRYDFAKKHFGNLFSTPTELRNVYTMMNCLRHYVLAFG